MSTTYESFHHWIKNANLGTPAEQKSLYRRLETIDDGEVVDEGVWTALDQLHTVARRGHSPSSGSEEDFRKYFVGILTNADSARQYGLIWTPDLPRFGDLAYTNAFKLLYRRYQAERSEVRVETPTGGVAVDERAAAIAKLLAAASCMAARRRAATSSDARPVHKSPSKQVCSSTGEDSAKEKLETRQFLWFWSAVCVGMMLLGFIFGGPGGLGAMIGVYGTLLFCVWLARPRGSRGSGGSYQGPVDTPGGRSSDMNDGG